MPTTTPTARRTGLGLVAMLATVPLVAWAGLDPQHFAHHWHWATGAIVGFLTLGWLRPHRDPVPVTPSAPADLAPIPPPLPESAQHSALEAILQAAAQGNFNQRLHGNSPLAARVNTLMGQLAEHQKALAELAKSKGSPAPDLSLSGLAAHLDRLWERQQASDQRIHAIVDAARAGNYTLPPLSHEDENNGTLLAVYHLISDIRFGLEEILTGVNALSQGELQETVESSYGGPMGTACDGLNSSIVSLREALGRIRSVVLAINRVAQQMNSDNQELARRTETQVAHLEETASSLEEITAAMQHNARHAQEAADFAQSAAVLASSGGDAMAEASQTMEAITGAAKRIAEIVEVIDGIAFQTNLLALNAAVESARAGDTGKGFAVVATEVRELSTRSAEAAKAIRVLITNTVNQIRTGSGQVAEVNSTMNAIMDAVSNVNQRMGEIQLATQEQAAGISQINEAITAIDNATQQNGELVESAARTSRQLDGQARGLHHLVNEFQLGIAGDRAQEIHAQMPEVVAKAAHAVARLWESAIDRGEISLSALCNDELQLIPGTEPPRFHSRFDTIADRLLPEIQEAILQQGSHLVYAIATTKGGYVPTHNVRYSDPLTGDPDYDRTHNRTKRVFNDPVGKRCGNHQLPYLLQTYRRDTGELMHDISAPILVKGRHWGGFRIGYRTDAENEL